MGTWVCRADPPVLIPYALPCALALIGVLARFSGVVQRGPPGHAAGSVRLQLPPLLPRIDGALLGCRSREQVFPSFASPPWLPTQTPNTRRVIRQDTGVYALPVGPAKPLIRQLESVKFSQPGVEGRNPPCVSII